MATTRVLIMAGGTGGHVFPALAVAEELRTRGVEVHWLGTHHGLEAEVVPRAGFPMHWVNISGVRGKSFTRMIQAPFKLARGLMQSLHVMRTLRPQAVLGMGGYTAGPGGLAARLLRRPLVIHEQNAIAGMTNRWLAPYAMTICAAFPDAFPSSPRVHVTGNPLRGAITRIAPPVARLIGRSGRVRLLVIGGSQGAQALNEAVPAALAQLPETLRPEVLHQAGRQHVEETRAHYARHLVSGRVEPFLDDMAQAYAWADLVLCRAGALTISELAGAGVASILVPFPHAVDDHQTRNAAYLATPHAAILLPQTQLNAATLAAQFKRFCSNDSGRRELFEMACVARTLARAEATHEVADLCLAAAASNPAGSVSP